MFTRCTKGNLCILTSGKYLFREDGLGWGKVLLSSQVDANISHNEHLQVIERLGVWGGESAMGFSLLGPCGIGTGSHPVRMSSDSVAFLIFQALCYFPCLPLLSGLLLPCFSPRSSSLSQFPCLFYSFPLRYLWCFTFVDCVT